MYQEMRPKYVCSHDKIITHNILTFLNKRKDIKFG